MPEANPDSPQPHQKHRYWHDLVATIGIPLTFLAALAAAFFTGMQWRAAVDAEKRQLRAYISIMGRAEKTNMSVGSRPTSPAEIKNVGVTPAFNVTVGTNIVVCPYPLKSVNLIRRENAIYSNFALFPGKDLPITISSDNPLTDEDARKIEGEAPRFRLCYLARVEYDDIWGKRHYTHFCVRCIPLVGSRVQHPEYCETYNDAN